MITSGRGKATIQRLSQMARQQESFDSNAQRPSVDVITGTINQLSFQDKLSSNIKNRQ